MAFRLPSQKKFKPNIGKATVPRKASIPASLAKPSTPGPRPIRPAPAASTSTSQLSQVSQVDGDEDGGPPSLDSGLPPGIGSSASGPPTIGTSQTGAPPTPTFREPSLPPASRKRAASPTPSNASRSSRTGGRPTMIHLAASSGPAPRPIRPAPAPSPTPAPTSVPAPPAVSPAPPSIPASDAPPSIGASPSPAPPTPVASKSSLPAIAPRPPALKHTTGQPPTVGASPSPAPPTPAVSKSSLPAIAPRPPAPKPTSGQPPTVGASQSPAPPTPAVSRSSLPAIAPKPPTPSFDSGLPPGLGVSQPDSTQSIAMPPSFSASQIDPALLDQTPGAGPSRSHSPQADTQQGDAAVTDETTTAKPKNKAPKLTKAGVPRKPYTRRTTPGEARTKKRKGKAPDAEEVGTETPGDGEPGTAGTAPAGEEGEDQTAPPVLKPTQKRRYKQKPLEKDAEGNWIRTARAPYKSKGKAKTDQDMRLKQNRVQRSTSQVPNTTEDGGEDHDPFAEDEVEPVDPGQVTMGSFAANFYDGDMTERAQLLKEAQKTKREDAQRERLEFERIKRIRLQPLRRRERAKRNEDRAARRIQWEADGAVEGEDEVSDDEQDSTDEEYDFEPDRLTPPGTPEPENYQNEAEEGEEQEGIRPDEANPDDEDEEQEGLGLDPNGEGPEYDEEVIPETQDVDLGDYGFNVAEEGDGNADATADAANAQPEEGEPNYDALFGINPGEGDEDDMGFDGDEPGAFSFADYQANMDNRREAALANQNSRFVVQEDDDEMRMVNSTTWQKRERTDKWTDDETDFFYSVLGEVGENYSMMKAFFPGRSVHQIKKKGLRENAKNPEKVTAAIMAKRPIDNKYLSKSAGYDPDRPWDKEEALFAEAKRDMDAAITATKEDRGEVVDKVDDMIGDPDQHDDVDMGYDGDLPEGEDGQQGQDQDAQDGEEEVAGGDGEEPDGPEGLFLPGGEEPGSP